MADKKTSGTRRRRIGPPGRVTLKEAARLLNLSVDAVSNYGKRQKLDIIYPAGRAPGRPAWVSLAEIEVWSKAVADDRDPMLAVAEFRRNSASPNTASAGLVAASA